MQIDMSVYTSRVHIWLCICCICQKYYACVWYPSTDGGWYSMSIYLFYGLFSNLWRIIVPILWDWTWQFMWKIWREAGMHSIFETISASISKIAARLIEFILCFFECRRTVCQYSGHQGAVRGLTVSTDGRILVSCGTDCT